MITTNIRALSIAGPFARLIAEGTKEIELRTWKTNYRGLVLLHSSASTVYDHALKAWEMLPEECPKSAIIGTATLKGCIAYTSARLWHMDEERHLWGETPYAEVVADHYGGKNPVGHIFENPLLFEEPIRAIPGALNYWTPRNERQHKGFEQAIALLNREAAIARA